MWKTGGAADDDDDAQPGWRAFVACCCAAAVGVGDRRRTGLERIMYRGAYTLRLSLRRTLWIGVGKEGPERPLLRLQGGEEDRPSTHRIGRMFQGGRDGLARTGPVGCTVRMNENGCLSKPPCHGSGRPPPQMEGSNGSAVVLIF